MTLLKLKQGPFYDPYEALPQGEREVIMRARLKEILIYARENSPFYRERLAQADLNSANPLKNVPYLIAQNLRDNLPPVNRNLLTSLDNGFTVFQSGGTTGIPKTSLFTHEELEIINRCNARGFFGVGLTEHDRVANLWAVGGLYMTFVHMNRCLQQYGCMSFPFSNQTPVDFVKTVTELFNINCFSGITSVVLNALREMDQKDRGKIKIEKVFFGGEHIYDADRNELQDRFGVKVIKAPGYGTVDSWYLGYQCQNTTNGIFHAFDDMVHLEMLDEETGAEVPRGEVGMLFTTVFVRKLTPIIRFRVGDKARWLKEPCPCGRTTPLFELLGRGDDVLRIGYDSVDYNSVQALLATISGASGRLQMEKQRKDGKDLLILRIETDAPANKHAEMSKELDHKFIEARPSFREFMKKGTIWPLQIEWLAEGKLPQNSRTGKLVRIIDAI